MRYIRETLLAIFVSIKQRLKETRILQAPRPSSSPIPFDGLEEAMREQFIKVKHLIDEDFAEHRVHGNEHHHTSVPPS